MAAKDLTPEELWGLSQERLIDAKALYAAGRYEGAFYICGYAVEMGLKYKICKTLGWDEYPVSEGGSGYKSFKTNKQELLALHTGLKQRMNRNL